MKLHLRIYKDGVTKFIALNKALKGNLQRKHWNARKQRFIPSAPYSKENNDMLVDYIKKYEQKAMNWNGSLEAFLLDVNGGDSTSLPDSHLFKDVNDFIIKELKMEKRDDGTCKGTFEVYEKLARRMQNFCNFCKISYEKLCIEDFTQDFVNRIFEWIRVYNNNKGYHYMSTHIHALLVRCEKWGFFDMGTVKLCRWSKKKKSSDFKYCTLSNEQCKQFINLDIRKLRHNVNNQLYHDFCVFILYTCQSACDAISLKYDNIRMIDDVPHFVFKRRKIAEKQSMACSVPINSVMQEIMDKWKPKSKDGYIFPIRNKQKIRNGTSNNSDIKHFISRCNNWLKKVGKIIDCDFPLHTYTFRHTGITHYISAGIPVVYVANLAGTSVDNCEKIYYNNRGDVKSRDKVLNALTF